MLAYKLGMAKNNWIAQTVSASAPGRSPADLRSNAVSPPPRSHVGQGPGPIYKPVVKQATALHLPIQTSHPVQPKAIHNSRDSRPAPPVYKPANSGKQGILMQAKSAPVTGTINNKGIQAKTAKAVAVERRPAPPVYSANIKQAQLKSGVSHQELRPAPPVFNPFKNATPAQCRMNFPGPVNAKAAIILPGKLAMQGTADARKTVSIPAMASASRVILPKIAITWATGLGRSGRVIQPMWVFIGDSKVKSNMTNNNDGTFTFKTDGNTYRSTGNLRDDCPIVELNDDSDDEMSDYSQHSLADSEDEFAKLGGRSKNVLATYRTHKHSDLGQVNTSEGLLQIVSTFDTGNQSAANTHVLFQGEDDDGYELIQLGTALGVKLYLMRFGFGVTDYKNVQAKWGKSAGVHTEMHLLHILTGGKKGDIPGCLNGYKLIVDKPVCADCYPYVVSASPDEVRDSTDFSGAGANTRQRWDTWTNPFK
jgi:hypothetical protein